MTSIKVPQARPLPKSATFEIARRVADLRAQGRTVLDLATGEPSFDTPVAVVRAAEQALRDGYTHYTPSGGLAETREAARETLGRHHGVRVRTEQVFIVPSAKYGIFASLASIVTPGDEVVLVGPHWVSYEPMLVLLGAVPRHLVLDSASNYRFSAPSLRSVMSSRTRAILINTPGNPSGRVLDTGEIEALAEVCADSDCWIVSDEIYAQIVFDGAVHLAPASHPVLAERTFTVGGLSKSHAMTGWRLGYVGVPQSAVNAMDATVQNTVGCAPAFVQRASVVAMREVDAEVGAMVAEYQRRRDELCGALASVPGFRLSTPQGALYAWVDVSRAGRGDGGEIARLLLDELGIAVAPGHAFGAEYPDFVRFAYGCGSDAISAACTALAQWSLTVPSAQPSP
ncbi:MAG: hypothetical protein QOE89_48 [Pseudonocardiales bacterium]|nr:hypothetical protein [Pseudonocardiales bacterium]